MGLNIVAEDGKRIEKYIDPDNFQPIVLFNEPIQLHSVWINKDENDKKKSYIVTLYTKTFQINIDRTIRIKI